MCLAFMKTDDLHVNLFRIICQSHTAYVRCTLRVALTSQQKKMIYRIKVNKIYLKLNAEIICDIFKYTTRILSSLLAPNVVINLLYEMSLSCLKEKHANAFYRCVQSSNLLLSIT